MNRFSAISILLLTVFFIFPFVACDRNHAPIISQITHEPATLSAGTVFTLKVVSTDEDGDILQYSWTCSGGEFLSSTNTSEVMWKSPVSGEGESFTIIATVSDGEYEETKEVIIELTEAVLGSITGYVYYKGCKVPVDNVIIRIGDKETISDADGKYSLSEIVSGKDTLTTSKQDFSNSKTVVSIPANSVLNRNIELISIIHSSKAFGIISDQDGEIVINAQVTMLNPDGSQSNLTDRSNDSGIFRIQYVPHGSRTLVVSKSANEEFKYPDINKEINFTEIEQRCNLLVEKIILKGQFTDIRDNQEYPFKTIGDQTWITKNLSYLPSVNPPSLRSDYIAYYYVYGYDGDNKESAKNHENYSTYGVLYNWHAASKACPAGWHLPSRVDWYTLRQTLGTESAHKMKATSGWPNRSNGDNSSGFTALPAGSLNENGNFSQLGTATYYFSSTHITTVQSYCTVLYFNYQNPYSQTVLNRAGSSVRCIRD